MKISSLASTSESTPLRKVVSSSFFQRTILLILLSKALFLWIDHAPNFFMGDSAAFIGTALTKWFPPQRSWTYGFFIRWFCLPVHGLLPLMLMQAVTGGVVSGALGICLAGFLNVPRRLTIFLMLISALDPLGILYERMVLPEAFSLGVLALLLTCCFAYHRSPSLLLLANIEVLLVALISLRMQFLLPVAPVVMLLPLLSASPLRRMTGINCGFSQWRLVALHFSFGLICFAGLAFSYAWAMGIKHQHPPALSYGIGFLVLGPLATLIQPEDASTPDLAEAIRNDSMLPLANRDLQNHQIWNPAGLAARIRSCSKGDFYAGDRDAKAIVRHAICRNPMGALRCGVLNHLGYWDLENMPTRLASERDAGPFAPAFTKPLLDHFSLDLSGYPHPAFSKSLHSLSPPWLLALLSSPLIFVLAVLLCRPELRIDLLMVAFIGTAFLIQNTFLSPIPVYRYLHPMAFPYLLALGGLAAAVLARYKKLRSMQLQGGKPWIEPAPFGS